MKPEQLITVYHCCCAWHYRRVVPWQLDHLAGVGLRHVLCTHVGEAREWLQEEAWKRGINLVIEWSSPNVCHYETPAMFLIERLAAMHQGAFLYLHTKGVSTDPGHYNTHWRHLMHAHLIEHWREVLGRMDEFDLAGVNWWDQGHHTRHFSGNFWMVRADWIRKLQRFDVWHNAWNRTRFSCEQWVGNAAEPQAPRALSLFRAGMYYLDFVKEPLG